MTAAGGKVPLPPLALAALAILVFTLVVRLPFVDVVGEDEAFFLVVAQTWRDGLIPYRDIFDIKPPGMFLATLAAATLLGPSILTMKLLAAAGVAAAALGLHLIARRHISPAVALWAPALYVVTSLFERGVDTPPLWVQAPFIVFAVLLALPGRERAAGLGATLAAGLLIGAAGMIKQTAVFEAVFVLALLLWRRPGRSWPGAVLAFGAAALVVPALFGLYFWRVGAFGAAFEQVVVAALARTAIEVVPTADGGAQPFSYGMAAMRLLPLMRPLLPVLCLSVLAWLRRRAITAAIGGTWFWVTAGWAMAALLGVLAARAVLASYLHTFVAPAALASAVLICHGLLEARRRRWLWQAGAAGLCVVVPPALEHDGLMRSSNDMPAIRAAVAAMRAAGARPEDGALALNRGMAVYVESGLLPRTRYFNPNHILCAFPTPDADPLAVALAGRPRFVLVAEAQTVLGCQRPERWATFTRFVAENYVGRAEVRGRWDRIAVWERRPSTAAP